MLKILTATLLIINCTAFAQNSVSKQPDTNQKTSRNGKAVLELFTSEGCSSCPAADKLAIKLKEAYQENLIVLEFHVDYWDKLGWKDPYSNANYTQRQIKYGEKFHLESIYTPQAVINGIYEAVGSDETTLKKYIDRAIELTKDNLLEMSVSDQGQNKITIKWKFNGPTDTQINIALVQKQSVINVKAGENRGRILPHTNIVREFLTVNSSMANKLIQFTIPDKLSKSDIQVIGYVEQNNKIVSATVLDNL